MDSKNYCCIRYLNPPNMFPIFIYAFFFFLKMFLEVLSVFWPFWSFPVLT